MSSAGTAADADCPVSADLLEWADELVVMEPRHARQLRQKFPRQVKGKRIVCLSIDDQYELMQPELVELLRARASRWL